MAGPSVEQKYGGGDCFGPRNFGYSVKVPKEQVVVLE